MSARVVTFNITLDADDNRTLEVAAGLLDKAPDELLIEAAGVPIADFLKRVVRDLRKALDGAHPTLVAVATARAIAREVRKRNGTG